MLLSDTVQAFIDAQRVARLATVDPSGAPHVVPVCFARLADRVYIVIDEKPKRTTRLQRLKNIEARPRAALLFDIYGEDWSRLAWVMVRGPATVLAAGDEHADALAALRARYPQYRAMALEERPVIRLQAERVAAWGPGLA